MSRHVCLLSHPCGSGRRGARVDEDAGDGEPSAVVPEQRLLGSVERQWSALEAFLGQFLVLGAEAVLIPWISEIGHCNCVIILEGVFWWTEGR